MKLIFILSFKLFYFKLFSQSNNTEHKTFGKEDIILSSKNDNYKLPGRFLVYREKVKNICDSEGTIVLNITVDPSGETLNAEPCIKKCRTLSKCLFKEAVKAALNSRWNAIDDVKGIQKGEITYFFRLK